MVRGVRAIETARLDTGYGRVRCAAGLLPWSTVVAAARTVITATPAAAPPARARPVTASALALLRARLCATFCHGLLPATRLATLGRMLARSLLAAAPLLAAVLAAVIAAVIATAAIRTLPRTVRRATGLRSRSWPPVALTTLVGLLAIIT